MRDERGGVQTHPHDPPKGSSRPRVGSLRPGHPGALHHREVNEDYMQVRQTVDKDFSPRGIILTDLRHSLKVVQIINE